jgi:hypothetical protein
MFDCVSLVYELDRKDWICVMGRDSFLNSADVLVELQ